MPEIFASVVRPLGGGAVLNLSIGLPPNHKHLSAMEEVTSLSVFSSPTVLRFG